MITNHSLSTKTGMKKKKSTAQLGRRYSLQEPPLVFSDFDKICEENSYSQRIPIFRKASFIGRSKLAEGNAAPAPAPYVYIGYKPLEKSINSISCANETIPSELLLIMTIWMNSLTALTELRLEFCKLDDLEINCLSKLLQHNRNIVLVSVNGNPNHCENFNLLLEKNSVTHLSLRFCNITQLGARDIANRLTGNQTSRLLYLNLSSNSLFDEGAQYIAQLLRGNRTVRALNLADNKISKTGCKDIMDSLKKFALNPDEIYIRRKRRFQYFQRKMDLMKLYKLLPNGDTFMPPGTRESVKKIQIQSSSSRQLKSSIKNGNRKPSRTSISSLKSANKIQHTMKLIEQELGTDIHPFVMDSWQEGGQIFCRGNFNLTSINLAYNNLTQDSMQSLLDVLRYQKEENLPSFMGLSRVIVEETNVKENSPEYAEFQLLLRGNSTSKRLSASVISGSFNRRHSADLGNFRREPVD